MTDDEPTPVPGWPPLPELEMYREARERAEAGRLADVNYAFRGMWRRLPVQLGFAGPKTCHTTPGGIRVHVKPWCRCEPGKMER